MLECVTGWLSMLEECDLLHPMLSNSYSWLVVFIKCLLKPKIIQGAHWSKALKITARECERLLTAHVYISGFLDRSALSFVLERELSILTRNVATTTRRFHFSVDFMLVFYQICFDVIHWHEFTSLTFRKWKDLILFWLKRWAVQASYVCVCVHGMCLCRCTCVCPCLCVCIYVCVCCVWVYQCFSIYFRLRLGSNCFD